MEMSAHTCKKGMKKLFTGVMKKGEKKPEENRKESYDIHGYMDNVGPSE